MAARGWILRDHSQSNRPLQGLGASACHCPVLVVIAGKHRTRQPHRKHLPSRARLTPSGNKLPSPLHAVLAWEKQVQGRTIIVGDVHGCFDELQELLAACSFNSNKDNLIFVGDIVNKGPKSAQVVKFAVEVGAYGVRGNHDDLALHALQYPASHHRKPKMAWLDEFEPEQVHFLDSLPFTLRLEGRDVLIVHAGIKPGRSLPAQRLGDLYSLRLCRPIGTMHGDKVPWASTWTGPLHVFFGHDAVRGLQRHAAATGLDTGCCYGQHLTACILPPLPSLPDQPQPPCVDRAAPGDSDGDNARAFAAVREEVSAQVARGRAEGKENRGGRSHGSKGFGGAQAPARKPQQRQPAKLKKWQPREDHGVGKASTLEQLRGELVSVPALLQYVKPKGSGAAEAQPKAATVQAGSGSAPARLSALRQQAGSGSAACQPAPPAHKRPRQQPTGAVKTAGACAKHLRSAAASR